MLVQHGHEGGGFTAFEANGFKAMLVFKPRERRQRTIPLFHHDGEGQVVFFVAVDNQFALQCPEPPQDLPAQFVGGNRWHITQIGADFGRQPVGLLEGQPGILQGADQDAAQEGHLGVLFPILNQNLCHG
jgi:hypothetical protein